MATLNTLQMAQLFQKQLDQQMLTGATSSWMEGNAGDVKYTGGDTVKIPTITMDGLGDYTMGSSNAYTEGSVSLVYKDYKMTMDRARKFYIDAREVDESGFLATAANVMGEFQRLHVIPEIDAYRYSKIIALATTKNKITSGYTPTEATILKDLRSDIAVIQDIVGEIPLNIVMSRATSTILENSSDIQKQLSISDFKNGQIDLKVQALDGNPLLKVPSARMKTKYVFNDGKTAGQTGGGFAPASDAKDIRWIIIPSNAPIAVSKTDTMRIFSPEINQSANGWSMDYRKFHDLWIKESMYTAISGRTA